MFKPAPLFPSLRLSVRWLIAASMFSLMSAANAADSRTIPPGKNAAQPVPVVASFSILGDMVRQVGGDRIAVTVLVPAGADAHAFQPRPSDARSVQRARLVFSVGMGFEGWLQRMMEHKKGAGQLVVVSQGLTPLPTLEEDDHGHHDDAINSHREHEDEHDHGAVDPHAWQDVAQARVFVRNIADALCQADGAGCTDYQQNAARYDQELKSLDDWIRREWAAVPPTARKVITSHDAFGYYAKAYGVTFLAAQGVSTSSEPTPKGVVRLIAQIRKEGAKALFVESISDPRLIEQIARETAVRPSGTLYSDSLSPKGGPAGTYVDLMRHNTRLMAGAAR